MKLDGEKYINIKALFHVLRINFLASIFQTSPDILIE